MRQRLLWLVLAALLLGRVACAVTPTAGGPKLAEIKAAREKLRPLHTPLGKPQPGEWLERFKEPGQTFEQYLAAKPITPNGKRRVIYLLPLGDFDKNQQRIVDLTQEYLGLCYNRPVKMLDPAALSVIPKDAQRVHPTAGMQQILTTYLLDTFLPPRLPEDGAALICLTATDLWPGEGWNFVFGQASLRNRVGVWSIARNGDPSNGDAGFKLCLRRTLMTSSHELGHMFSIEHCTRYKCNMCGSNSQGESDRQPLAFCPECAAKVWWATGTQPADYYRKLAAFTKQQGLAMDAEFLEKSLTTLTTK